MFVLLMVMAMMSGLCGCGAKKVIHIASKPMTEQYILTEIIAQLIEAETDYETEITKGVGGGTTNIHPALIKGEFDLYPEYTRTAWLNVLKKEEMEKDDEKLYAQLQEEYDALGLTWTGLYGFSNTYGLALRQETADQYGLATYSDLAAASGELTFGGNPDYIAGDRLSQTLRGLSDAVSGCEADGDRLKIRGFKERRSGRDQCLYDRCAACRQ